eukprot:TRINITY_DN7228_c0_g1_i3.p1 TRINITY_DN7228_c0_g1~~TRINITY_DN7228_c0_g1_i3.p1  ORF type:complete len:122 (-),score=8.90 TRINITY_DN7228_c0_g1_i3:274-609(-)
MALSSASSYMINHYDLPVRSNSFQRNELHLKSAKGFLTRRIGFVRCQTESNGCTKPLLITCRQCKKQFDPRQNHPRACVYHTAHFGGKHGFGKMHEEKLRGSLKVCILEAP